MPAKVHLLSSARAERHARETDPHLDVAAGPGFVVLQHTAERGQVCRLDRLALVALMGELEAAGQLAGWLPREDDHGR